MRSFSTFALALLSLAPAALTAEEKAAPKTAKEGLQAFNDLIGSWRATGTPFGTFEERQKGFWTEKVAWVWRFKGKDVWLEADIEEGKHYTSATLHYLPEKAVYRLAARAGKDKEPVVFEGTLADRRLTLEHTNPKTKAGERIVLSFLHSNRYLWRYEERDPGRTVFRRKYQVGATKEGVAFAKGGSGGPECVVSGGLGTMAVTHKGKTYYVCCSGCRDAFIEDPEGFLKEFEKRKKKAD